MSGPTVNTLPPGNWQLIHVCTSSHGGNEAGATDYGNGSNIDHYKNWFYH